MAVVELSFDSNNLYRTGQVILFTDGEAVLTRDVLSIEATEEDKYHPVVHLDTLDKLAYKYYSGTVEDASKFWWVIADANNIENPLDISAYVGINLLIPNIINVLLKLED